MALASLLGVKAINGISRRRAAKIAVADHLKTIHYYHIRHQNTMASRRRRNFIRTMRTQVCHNAQVKDFNAIDDVVAMANCYPDAMDDESKLALETLRQPIPYSDRALIVNPIIQQPSHIHDQGIAAETMMMDRIKQAIMITNQLRNHVRHQIIKEMSQSSMHLRQIVPAEVRPVFCSDSIDINMFNHQDVIEPENPWLFMC